MPTIEPYTLTSQIILPADTGEPVGPRDYSIAGTFIHRVEYKLALTGSGTHVVGFGSIPSPAGAKMVAVKYENDGVSLPVINLHVNGGSINEELSAGGLYLISNPSPSAGIASISILYTGSATVRVLLLA